MKQRVLNLSRKDEFNAHATQIKDTNKAYGLELTLYTISS
jgi:hypothetical protein